jgi:uncharacterized damage-inducible protein DinB
MSAMTPDQASFLLQFELPALKNEHRTTSSVIKAIPVNAPEYRPDPLSKTAPELAWHIAATEQRFLSAIVGGAFDFSPLTRPESVKNSADIADWYDKSFETYFSKLSELSPEQATKILDFRGLFQLPAVAFIRFASSHTIHHRGQLSTHLRALGGKVPAIYGESYDSAEAKKSATA